VCGVRGKEGRTVKHVTLTLTLKEAVMLSSVAGNGWGNGDFGDWLGDGRKTAACLRAMEKLNDAIRAVQGLSGEESK
jgi:hypothetical protein